MIRWAHKKKFKLINVVRREEQVDQLREMGAPHVLSSEDPHFERELHLLAAKLGARVAFEAVAGRFANTILRAMPRDESSGPTAAYRESRSRWIR